MKAKKYKKLLVELCDILEQIMKARDAQWIKVKMDDERIDVVTGGEPE
jgi:hypothetical protein